MKQFLLWGAAGIVLAGGLWAVFTLSERSEAPNDASLLSASASLVVRARGSESASVVLVEYGDFQCPACAVYASMVERIAEEFGDRVQIEFRHFPLTQIHENAELASKAAEAAGYQGKFWEMHNVLFERQASWAKDSEASERFRSYAEDLELDGDRFTEDLFSKSAEEKVRSDMQSGWASNVTGTPTFFLNGKKMPYPRNYEEFKQLIENELAS